MILSHTGMSIKTLLFLIGQILHALLAQETAPENFTPAPPPPEVIGTGFIAEWEYEEDQTPPHLNGIQLDEDIRPSPRVGPATWTDSRGTWWLFGGQSPPAAQKGSNQSGVDEFLGDLWAYNLEGSRKWVPIFQPVHEAQTPLSSYPQNILHQILCGSGAHGHLAVFGGLGKVSQNGKEEPADDPLLQEDNTVWLYDIPQPHHGPVPPDGLWTSYICCDACLPTDSNTTLEFCPHFDQSGRDQGASPLVWCSTDAISAIQLTGSEGVPALDWWKFSLGSTEWIKVAENEGGGGNISALFHPRCRTASDEDVAYVLCPPMTEGVENSGGGPPMATREVYILDTVSNSIRWLSRISLNVVIDDEGLWENGGSVLGVIKSGDSQTLLLIAYKKLLDFWLHDHSTGKFEPLENIWKGGSLNYWQHTRGFYHLQLTFPSPTNPATTNTIYLPNPRSRVLNFDDEEASKEARGIFRVLIKADTGVFLPMRDSEFILKADTGAEPSVVVASTPSPNWPPPPPPPSVVVVQPSLSSSGESRRKFNSGAKPIIPLLPSSTNPWGITTSPGPMDIVGEELGKLDPSPNNSTTTTTTTRTTSTTTTTILLTKLKSNPDWTSPEEKVQKSNDSSPHFINRKEEDERTRRISKVPAILHLPLQRGKTIGAENESNLLIGRRLEGGGISTTTTTTTTEAVGTTTKIPPTDISSTESTGTTVQNNATGENIVEERKPTVDNVLHQENHKRAKRKVGAGRKRQNRDGGKYERKREKITEGLVHHHLHHKARRETQVEK